MIHTSPSYSCLLTLEEKPNVLTTFALSSQATTAPQPLITCHQGLFVDDAHFRDISPLAVVLDDQVLIDDTADGPAVSLFMCPSSHEPLKWERSQERARDCRIRFCPTVDVTLIPSHREYSDASKLQMWASTEEIRVNAVKAQMELCLYDHRYAPLDTTYGQDGVDEPERRFAPLSRLQKAR